MARSGHPIVEVNGIPYHSPYDPLRETEKFYSGKPIETADVVMVFGWGLGYCGEVLRRNVKPAARIVVFEPDEDLFNLSLAQLNHAAVLQDQRFRFVVGQKACESFEEWGLEGGQETDQLLWIEWPPALRSGTVIFDLLKAKFQKYLRDRAANLLTHFKNGAKYFANAIANFEFQHSPDAGCLFDRFRNVPVVIVSAGPSLDRNIQELRGVDDRYFLLAVDTAIRPLLAAGVTPHAAIIADPSELNARHVTGAIPESTYLIAEQAVDSSALAAASRRFLFGLGLFPDSLFGKFGFGKSRLDVWGSVATAALDMACRMGANPIIFAGQDFAFSAGRDYASHTIYHGIPFSAEESGPLQEPDVFGRPVRTTENLIAYRDFFTRKIRRSPGIRFINATEGGILRKGVEILSLRDALQQVSPRPVDIAGVLGRSYRGRKAPIAALRHLVEILKSHIDRCGCLSAFLDLVAKEAVLKKDSAVLKDKISWGIEIVERALEESLKRPS
jgi:hypothetical protein